jgi:hypothetical protein
MGKRRIFRKENRSSHSQIRRYPHGGICGRMEGIHMAESESKEVIVNEMEYQEGYLKIVYGDDKLVRCKFKLIRKLEDGNYLVVHPLYSTEDEELEDGE